MPEEALTERRRAERRQLANKPFLALLIGALPEDRRKYERRASTGRLAAPAAARQSSTRDDAAAP